MMIPGLDVARYLTSRDYLPTARCTGYDYILAGNGLFKRAHGPHVEACLPLASVRIAGLPDMEPYVRILFPRLPERMLLTALADARRVSMDRPAEAMYHVYHLDDGRVRLAKPRQDATAAHLRYDGGGDPRIVLDLHSHCEAGAFYSGTDTHDEGGFRFYAVMGHVFTRPALALRLGIYGDHWPVEPDTLFEGLGPFHLVGDHLIHSYRGDGMIRSYRKADYYGHR